MSTFVEEAVKGSPVFFVDIAEDNGASKPTCCRPRVLILFTPHSRKQQFL
jgi:hypothetical protein